MKRKYLSKAHVTRELLDDQFPGKTRKDQLTDFGKQRFGADNFIAALRRPPRLKGMIFAYFVYWVEVPEPAPMPYCPADELFQD